jgi:glutamine amidotransferase-like uncharacterized protein
MKNKILIFLAITAIFMLSGSVLTYALTCPIQSDTNIVVYTDTGAGGIGTSSKSWMQHFFGWWQSADPNIKWVEIESASLLKNNVCDLGSYPNIKLYVQPGGDAYKQQNSLSSGGRANILDYLDNHNGAYLGTCAGFYYVANDYYWQDQYYAWPNMLQRYPTLEGSIREIADYDARTPYTVTSLSNGLNAIYYGGPTRNYEVTNASFPGVVLAEYNALPERHMPAAIKYGKMLLTSVHFEAYENDGISGLSTADREQNYKYLAQQINDVAGTNFIVPGVTTTTTTSSTTTSTSGTTTTTTQPTGPITVFSDNFEAGNLNKWTVTGAGKKWVITNTGGVYQGTYAAYAKQPGTSTTTYMETTISVPAGYTTVIVDYYRKLVGIDGADEYSSEYYNGNWVAMESTGSNPANDASYVHKTYTIPSTATKIRFTCLAGAVSEMCYVDNILVTAQ